LATGESEERPVLMDLALSVVRAAESGQGEEVAANFAPEAVIWHNTDEVTLTMTENFPPLVAFMTRVPERRSEDLRVTEFAGGFILQHRIVGTTDDGEPFALPSCAVMRVQDGKIVSLDEYFDSAPLARLGIDSWLPKD
jgi:ketosteroid isomerase-like protein